MNLPSKIDKVIRYLLVIFSYLFIIPIIFFTFLWLIVLLQYPTPYCAFLVFACGASAWVMGSIIYEHHKEKETK